MDKFKEINCDVVAVSIDSKYTHLAWVNTPRKQGGVGELKLPLLADVTKKVSTDYEVLVEEDGIALRFITNFI